MGSEDKYFSVESADKGFDYVGTSQPTGAFSGATSATPFGPRYAGKTKIAIVGVNTLRNRQPINITSTDSYLTGKSSVLKVLGATQVIINKTFSSGATSGTGTFDTLGGEGSWDAFQPISADLPGPSVAMTFWDSGNQGAQESATGATYSKDVIYRFPNTIKTILLGVGNIRLIRAATLRPGGETAQ